jgi:hypothetical protein
MAYLYASMPARSTFVEDAHVNSHYIQLTPRYGYDANRAPKINTSSHALIPGSIVTQRQQHPCYPLWRISKVETL